MRARHRVALVLALAACEAPGAPGPMLAAVTPPYGPLSGGARLVLEGGGFIADDAGRNRVLIAGREAPLVAALDDARLEVVLPPGAAPGAAEVVVFNARGTAAASTLFRYSEPPEIDAVAPARMVFDARGTVTVTGRGFRDEGAGEVTVLVDGQPAEDVAIVDDTTLTFTAPVGHPLARAVVEVIDARGAARAARGYHNVPSARPGLLLVPSTSAGTVFFYEPATRALQLINTATSLGFTALVRDGDDDLWAIDRAGRYGRVDPRLATLVEPIALGLRVPAMVRVGAALVVIDRGTRRVGTFDPETRTFTALGDDVLSCCGSWGLAYDGAALYATARGTSGAVTLTRIDPATGAFEPPVELTGIPNLHLEDLRFLAGTLYATSRAGALVRIDPVTGATTVVETYGRFQALEAID